MTTQKIMLLVVLALVPAIVAATVVFGPRALFLVVFCAVISMFTEMVCQKLMQKETTYTDGSAMLTGVLLALNLPATLPLWEAAIGCVFAIAVVKQLFGGLGCNFANPAITGRVFLLLSFGGDMTTWVKPFFYRGRSFFEMFAATGNLPDGVTGATPLASGDAGLLDLFLGNVGGSLGETSALALLIGGVLGALSAGQRGVAALPIQLFVNSVRNIPPLVLLFLLYFFAGNLLPVSDMEQALRSMPPFVRDAVAWGFAPEGQLDRMVAAVLTLGVYEGAYVTEIVRGGIEGVPHGQWEASAALGFSRPQQLRLVIFPQAVRAILPPLVGQVITTFKDSALASLISLPDLTFQALEVMAISRMTFEVWISAGAIYLLLGVLCARYGRWLETRETWKA